MNGEYLLILTVIFSMMLLVIQRSEKKYRRTVGYTVLIFGGGVILFFLNLRPVVGEAILGFFLGLIFNLIFYILIGRYNPVGSSDDNIQVLGMDD